MRAMAYRFAIEAATGVPDARARSIRLISPNSPSGSAPPRSTSTASPRPRSLARHGWAHDYLDAFSETIAGGTAEIQRNIIGERVLGLPKS